MKDVSLDVGMEFLISEKNVMMRIKWMMMDVRVVVWLRSDGLVLELELTLVLKLYVGMGLLILEKVVMTRI